MPSLAEIHYLDAPHGATGAFLGDIDADSRGAPLGWWNTSDDTRPAISSAYVGLEESVAAVERCVEEEGPFDGVFGRARRVHERQAHGTRESSDDSYFAAPV